MLSSKYTAQEISGVPLETVRLRYELVVDSGADPREHATVFDEAMFTLASGVATLAVSSRTYACATSSPSRPPAFVRSNDTNTSFVLPGAGAGTFTRLYLNVV